MKRIWRVVAWVAGLAVLVVLVTPLLTSSLKNKSDTGKQTADGGKGGDAKGDGKHHGHDDGPVPVYIAAVKQADVPVYVEGVGTGQALNSVLIRSQVDGILNELDFTEGQLVKPGDTLAIIDPRLYQAALDQNVAKKKLDEAVLANNKRDLERYQMLAKTKAVTQQQLDTQVATVAQTEAQIAIDQGLIESARTTLSYTKITSPIAGRTGIRKVDVGNLIHAADTTGIVTVSQIQPISVVFNIPQQELPRINKASLLNRLDVEALDGSGNKVVDHGLLVVVDNTIDASTGTVKLKANFDNPQLQLWPGIFTNVRLRIETLKNALIIPVSALQRGPNGTFVFLATPQNTAKMQTVVVSQQDDTQAVISSGLTPGQNVVTTGFQRMTDGAKLKPATDPAAQKEEQTPGIHQPGLSPVSPNGNAPQQHHRGRRQSASE